MAAIGNRGTVKEASGFDPEADAQRLRGAMKGVGTDEAAIIEVLAHRTIAQRQRIKEAYKQAVGKDLADELSSELSGNFRSVVLGLLMLAPVYDAFELRSAMKGAGTEEACLIDILASRSNAEIKTINAFYKKEYGKDLEDAVCGDTSGMFQRVLVSLLTAGRDESNNVDGIFTSVYTTCDIPENAIFGPCVLSHTSLYDSIAFIALKSTDKRTAPYIFRVDTSAANSTSEGLMWLRLVQSARDKEEQNLEAYVKNGQLLYRSLRRIEKDEELLVWYGKDLIDLLLLSSSRAPAKSKGSSHHSCPDCNQRFQFEFPFLAHLRFRCTKRLQNITGADDEPSKDSSTERPNTTPTRTSPKLGRSEGFGSPQDSNKPSTDFHNLARDLENNRTSPPSDKEAEICSESSGKRKFSEIEDRECRGPNLPQSKSKDELATSAQNYRGAYGLEENHRSFSPPGSTELGQGKRSAFTEVKKSPQNLKHHSGNKNLQSSNSENKDGGRPSSSPPEKHLNIRQVLSETQPPQTSPMGSAFTSVTQQGGSGGERKSAFSQPSRSSFSQISPLVMPTKLLDCHPAVGDTISSNRLYQADHLAAKLQGAELGTNCPVPGGMAKQNPFVYATTFWPKNSGAIQLQMPSALTLLPPSFTSLCLPAQNWCAKCNASFRMTSDLVYHMRSHHKKEYSMEPLVKRRREEKLKCPICNESFRERHHLSRHMTSHN